MARKILGKILELDRLPDSPKGGPRWRVQLTPYRRGEEAGRPERFVTQPESDAAYLLSQHLVGTFVEIVVERAITITHIRLLSGDSARRLIVEQTGYHDALDY